MATWGWTPKAQVEELFIIRFAGVVAERMLSGQAPTREIEGFDWELVRELRENKLSISGSEYETDEGHRRYERALQDRSWTLIQSRLVQVRALTELLMRKGTAEPEEVDELLGVSA